MRPQQHILTATGADTLVCHASDAPKPIDTSVSYTVRPDYISGISPQIRPILPGYDSAVVCMLLGVVTFLALCISRSPRFLKNFANDLFMIRRRRTNAFDDHTVNETRTILAFILLVCLCEGVMLFTACGSGTEPFTGVGVFTVVALIYYLFQITAYSTVATVFAGRFECSQWIRSFNASQSLLGLGLFVPALIALFDPAHAAITLVIASALYTIARIIFIIKGFRIFYSNLFSSIYFILYLCTLEIVPPVFIYKASVSLGFLNH